MKNKHFSKTKSIYVYSEDPAVEHRILSVLFIDHMWYKFIHSPLVIALSDSDAAVHIDHLQYGKVKRHRWYFPDCRMPLTLTEEALWPHK